MRAAGNQTIAIRPIGYAALLALLMTCAFTASPAADAPESVLAWWEGTPSNTFSDWTQLHALAGGSIGLLPPESAAFRNPAIHAIGPYAERGIYLLVSSSIYASLQAGELPQAWQAALSADARRAVTPEDLRTIPLLARDHTQLLIQLPESLRAVSCAPGCRAQRLRTPLEARAAFQARTDRGPTGTPGSFAGAGARPQPPEFWHALSDAARSDRLFADLDYLATTLQTRYSTTSQMDLACQYVKAAFEALGLAASFDPFVVSGHATQNVVAVKPGAIDPSRIYIVCGHLDSTSPNPYNVAPGAEDNGSGSAAVLEAARLLAPLQTDYTVYFICFSGEEQGLVGSEHFAAEADQQGLDIRGVLNMDMVAYYEAGGADLWVEGFHYGTSSVWLMDLVGQNAQSYADLAVYQYPGEGWGSDHEPFHSHGYSAVLLIENEWDNYACYHRTCDTVDQLNASLWRRITAANLVTAAQLAQLGGSLGGISGLVRLSDGAEPSGVTLRLAGTAYPERVSTASGAFTWSALFPTTYTLTAEKEGYFPSTLEVAVPSGSPTLVSIMLQSQQSGLADGTLSLGAPLQLRVAPNPMTASSVISLRAPEAQAGRLSVYAADGRRVVDLAVTHLPAAADHAFSWDGRDATGSAVGSGLYWVRWEGARARGQAPVVVIR